MKIKFGNKRKGKIASLSPLQIQKLREYEKEMDIILVAYRREKDEEIPGQIINTTV